MSGVHVRTAHRGSGIVQDGDDQGTQAFRLIHLFHCHQGPGSSISMAIAPRVSNWAGGSRSASDRCSLVNGKGSDIKERKQHRARRQAGKNCNRGWSVGKEDFCLGKGIIAPFLCAARASFFNRASFPLSFKGRTRNMPFLKNRSNSLSLNWWQDTDEITLSQRLAGPATLFPVPVPKSHQSVIPPQRNS